MRKKLTQNIIRANNVRMVLNLIRDLGPISRASISRLTGLTKSTVSDIVSQLMETGIIKAVGVESSPSKVGRKGILLDINSSEFLVIGYDVGTLTSRVVLTDLEGNVIRSEKFPTVHGTDVVDQVEEKVKEISGELWEKVVWVGVGAPGMIDRSGGKIAHSPNLGIMDLSLVEILEERFEKRVTLEHNVKLMMKAEIEVGKARGKDSVLLLNIGPGIGSAFYEKGRILRGSHGFAGEIGHTTVVEEGELCSCGKRGCLETVAAAWGIVRRYNSMSPNGVEGKYDAEVVAERARNGDDVARAVFEEAGYYLGMAIANAVNILDPEIVVLAGGITYSWDLMAERFEEAFESNLIDVLRGKVRVEISELGELSTALGASEMAVEEFMMNVSS